VHEASDRELGTQDSPQEVEDDLQESVDQQEEVLEIQTEDSAEAETEESAEAEHEAVELAHEPPRPAPRPFARARSRTMPTWMTSGDYVLKQQQTVNGALETVNVAAVMQSAQQPDMASADWFQRLNYLVRTLDALEYKPDWLLKAVIKAFMNETAD